MRRALERKLMLGGVNQIQKRNERWWQQNMMSYDWHGTIKSPEGTREFFKEIDRRFYGASPFFAGTPPFAKLIPFDSLRGKRVLEIGCGLGAHVELLCKAGCSVAAIDLTEKAVKMTRKRLSLSGLTADVRQMDAERIGFTEGEFDFVWSWGVIHHSVDPERILSEVNRVLKRSGELRLMVYHRRSLVALSNVTRGVFSGKLFYSKEDILNNYSDGYIARFYTRTELSKMLRGSGLPPVSISVLGQKSELVPLPGVGTSGRLKSALLSKIPDILTESILSRWGGFLFGIAVKAD